MKPVTFYIKNYYFNHELNILEQLACNLAIIEWCKWKIILILCENNSQALNIDKALWKNDINAFVPHNLSGESPYSVPVEIYWQKRFCNISRDILISLLPVCVEFF